MFVSDVSVAYVSFCLRMACRRMHGGFRHCFVSKCSFKECRLSDKKKMFQTARKYVLRFSYTEKGFDVLCD